MPKTKLTTKGEIDALPHPATGQTLYWADDLRGFGVLVGKHSKSFVVQREVKGTSRRISIGRYPDTSLHLARKQAEQLGGTMRGGTDPVIEARAATGDNITLREAWTLYEGHLTAKERSPVTHDGYWMLLKTHCADWLDRPLVEITPEAAQARHVQIGKKRGKYAANGVMRVLRAIWRRALKQHRGIGLPPTINVDFNKEKSRTAVIKVEDLPAWWRGLQAIENPIRRDLYIWLLFTACRSGEAKTLRWEQIDFDAGSVHFPLTKTDSFDLPLSSFLVDLLKARRADKATRAIFGNDCPWVFPAHGDKGHVAEPKLNAKEQKLFPKATKADKTTTDWTPHTLRHTWITISENKMSMPSAHSHLLANHAIPKSRDAHMGYIHPDLEDLRKSQQKMTKFLLGAIRPKTKPKRAKRPKPSGNVVPFAKARARR